MGPRNILNSVEKRIILCSYREYDLVSSAVQPITYSL
jgi:hypothetical protein